MTPAETAVHTSAGGVIFRRAQERVEVALILVAPQNRWQLPKGTVSDGETLEAAALREVREETGLHGAIVAPLEAIEYWFSSRRGGKPMRFHKFVHFFLMRYQHGDVADHDQEVEEARWVEVEQAVEMLAFASEKRLVRMAIDRMAEL